MPIVSAPRRGVSKGTTRPSMTPRRWVVVIVFGVGGGKKLRRETSLPRTCVVLPHWPQLPIEPVERLANQDVARHVVHPARDHQALPVRRRAQQVEHGSRRGLEGKRVVVPPVHHQHRHVDPRDIIDVVCFWLGPDKAEPCHGEDSGTEPWLYGEHHAPEPSTPTVP